MMYRLARLSTQVLDYLRGGLEIFFSDAPRYVLVMRKINVCYLQGRMQAEVVYTSLQGCRKQTAWAADLSDAYICQKFKPGHVQMLIGLRTLEACLNLDIKEHVQIYVNFIASCEHAIQQERARTFLN